MMNQNSLLDIYETTLQTELEFSEDYLDFVV